MDAQSRETYTVVADEAGVTPISSRDVIEVPRRAAIGFSIGSLLLATCALLYFGGGATGRVAVRSEAGVIELDTSHGHHSYPKPLKPWSPQLPKSGLYHTLPSTEIITGTVPVGGSLDEVDWSTKPHWRNFANMARWLVHWSDYGVAATICSEKRSGCPKEGDPFGNIMAIADGTWAYSTGVIITYLPDVDPSQVDLAADPHMTITFTEKALPGGCVGETAEDPPCARLTISGKMTKIPPEHVNEAKKALFSKHPSMKTWPADHGYSPYWIAKDDMTSTLFFLDMYGPAYPMEPSAYFEANDFLHSHQQAPVSYVKSSNQSPSINDDYAGDAVEVKKK